MFCIYLRINSDLCHLQHKLIGFYNRDEKCLQRGTDWVFKCSGLRFYILPTEYVFVLYVFQKETLKFFLYSTQRLVFKTEMKIFYSAVRTGSLKKAVCASSLRFNASQVSWIIIALLLASVFFP